MTYITITLYMVSHGCGFESFCILFKFFLKPYLSGQRAYKYITYKKLVIWTKFFDLFIVQLVSLLKKKTITSCTWFCPASCNHVLTPYHKIPEYSLCARILCSGSLSSLVGSALAVYLKEYKLEPFKEQSGFLLVWSMSRDYWQAYLCIISLGKLWKRLT